MAPTTPTCLLQAWRDAHQRYWAADNVAARAAARASAAEGAAVPQRAWPGSPRRGARRTSTNVQLRLLLRDDPPPSGFGRSRLERPA